MRSLSRLVGLALTTTLAACTASQTPVPVSGSAGDIAALQGHWSGDYSSTITGRTGSIEFTLDVAKDSAFGDVIMVPCGWEHPLRPWVERDRAAQPQSPPPRVLTIRFVRVANNRVSGALDPYEDPETGAPLRTRLEGRIVADTISGTFVTMPGAVPGEPTGHWKVVRGK